MRNLANENIHNPGKNGGYNTFISFILDISVKADNEQFETGTDQITLIETNSNVVDFYAGLDEQDIEFSGKVDIKSAEIEELKSLLGIGEKTAEKIICKRDELEKFTSEEDLMLVLGIGSKTLEKLLPFDCI